MIIDLLSSKKKKKKRDRTVSSLEIMGGSRQYDGIAAAAAVKWNANRSVPAAKIENAKSLFLHAHFHMCSEAHVKC